MIYHFNLNYNLEQQFQKYMLDNRMKSVSQEEYPELYKAKLADKRIRELQMGKKLVGKELHQYKLKHNLEKELAFLSQSFHGLNFQLGQDIQFIQHSEHLIAENKKRTIYIKSHDVQLVEWGRRLTDYEFEIECLFVFAPHTKARNRFVRIFQTFPDLKVGFKGNAINVYRKNNPDSHKMCVSVNRQFDELWAVYNADLAELEARDNDLSKYSK